MKIFVLSSSICLVLLCLLSEHTTNAIREISHEDIRDAILSLVHMFRDNTDKLERHEYRERQLAEQFKKVFTNIEKKQKTEEISINSITETLGNINDRLQKIESFIQSEKDKPKEETQTQTQMQPKDFEKILTKLENLETNIVEKKANADEGTNISEQLKTLTDGIQQLKAELIVVQEKLKQTIEATESNIGTTPTTSVGPSVAEIKLAEIQTAINNLQETYSKMLHDEQENFSATVKTALYDVAQRIAELPKKDDIGEIANITAQQLQEVKYDILLNSEKGVVRVQDNIAKLQESINEQRENILKTIAESVTTGEKWHADVQSSYLQLLKEITSLSKVEQVLIQTADNVLDTKKRIEYGTHHILLEVSDLVKQQSKETNATISKKFDEVSRSILENQNNGLANVSSKIEIEISQVWRQINIMYQTLTSTSSSLKHLENQTEMYVNGSLNTMHSMENKVGQIRSGMLEVDDNLNYLLGRLSLVTQEFNQIKTGLGEALEQVRANFHAVKAKVEEDGPGPNYFENGTTEYPIIDSRQLSKSQYEVNKKK